MWQYGQCLPNSTNRLSHCPSLSPFPNSLCKVPSISVSPQTIGGEGDIGVTYLLFKVYQVTKDGNDLNLCSEIVKACDSASVDSRSVVDEVITAGRQLGRKGRYPLMYEWHGKKYWGAAHGLAGIMHVLMDMELKPDEVEDVKGMLRYMINNHFSCGNYPSSEGSENDRLVHWCHGAPGLTLTLVKAAEVIFSLVAKFKCKLPAESYRM